MTPPPVARATGQWRGVREAEQQVGRGAEREAHGRRQRRWSARRRQGLRRRRCRHGRTRSKNTEPGEYQATILELHAPGGSGKRLSATVKYDDGDEGTVALANLSSKTKQTVTAAWQ